MDYENLEPFHFQTDFIPINIQILESVLYNAQKYIPRMKLHLQFDDEVKYKSFAKKLSPTLGQDQDLMNNSESDDSEVDKENMLDATLNDLPYSTPQIQYQEKLSRLELSIILKEWYKKEVDNIMIGTGVRILIVPSKIKYFGPSYESIQEAKSSIHEIKIKIVVSCLQNYGKEAFQSYFMRQKLKSCGIELGKVAEKYYYWYEYDETKQKFIKEVLSELFHRNAHVFYPLYQNYEAQRRRSNTNYIDALIKTRARLYEQYLNHQINDDKNQLYAELNKEKTEIILHIPVKQQSQTIIYEIKSFFSQIVHFFIHYKVQDNQEIENIQEIQKLLQEKKLLWFRQKQLLVLNFRKKGYARSHENMNSSNHETDNRDVQFLQQLKQVFKLNLNFYIEYLGLEDKNIDDNEEKSIPLLKRITKQYKAYDNLFVISPKTQLLHLFIEIVDYFILKPAMSQEKQKKKQNSTVLHRNNDLNLTSIIRDTTVRDQSSITHQVQENSLIQTTTNQPDRMATILSGLRENYELQNYYFYFQDSLGEQKYQQISQVSRGKLWPSQSREKLQLNLEAFTDRKYQIYKVIIPGDFKVDFSNAINVVTVFVRDSDKYQFQKQSIQVYLMTNKTKALSGNGWLLNTPKQNIKETSFSKYELENRKFEIVAYIKYIEG